MNLTHEGKIYALILLASAFFSIFAITFNSFPYLGFSLSFILFTLIAYYVKKEKTFRTKIFFVITLALSFFLLIRSEGSVTFLNIFSVFFFGILMVVSDSKEVYQSLISLFSSPLAYFAKAAFLPNEYHLEYKSSKKAKTENSKNVSALVSLFLTFAVILVIIPLLSSANPFFEKFILNILDFFGLRDVKLSEKIFQWIWRLVIFFIMAVFVPKMATAANKKIEFPKITFPNLNLLLPKIAVAVILVIFFITQLQLYFSTPETLTAMGYTNSQYVREVFAQLSAVAFIVILLLFNDKGKTKIDKFFIYGLLLSGFFLTFMAYKSDLDYVNKFGFTYKRLYGFAVATWILGVFAIYSQTFIKNLQKSNFIYKSLVLTGIILIAINLANFDYLIYHFRKTNLESGIDYRYLATLSADSLSFRQQAEELSKLPKDNVNQNEIVYDPVKAAKFMFINKLKYLQEKYRKFDIRTFNLLEYLQYKDIKDLNLEELKTKFNMS